MPNISKRVRGTWSALVLLLAVGLSACSGAQIVALDGAARDAALVYSEPMTDNLLSGMNEADYSRFARDFDETMRKAVSETAFQDMLNSIGAKLGAYQAREVTLVEDTGAYIRVTYKASFANEDGVTVRVVFNDSATDHRVSGLWFDSPKLRQK